MAPRVSQRKDLLVMQECNFCARLGMHNLAALLRLAMQTEEPEGWCRVWVQVVAPSLTLWLGMAPFPPHPDSPSCCLAACAEPVAA